MKHVMNKVIAGVGAVAMLASVAACGSTGASDGGDQKNADGKTEITLWMWGTGPDKMIAEFEKANPDIKVNWVNAGTGEEQYIALNNAFASGKGAPDVIGAEYYALPQLALSGELLDLTEMGAADLKDDYTPGTWSSVNINGGIYGLPLDSGPMAFFYNKEIFDKAGVTEAPTTWDEYYEAAKKIHALGDNYYITSDAGDAGFFDSMVWQAGGHPFETSEDGKTVSIDLTGDEGTQKFVEYWQKMIDEGLINTKTKGWTDEWNKGLGDGTIASLITGAWMPMNLESGAPQASGKWRVANTPTWEEGGTENSENGGSAYAVVSNTKKKEAAYKFVKWCSNGDGAHYNWAEIGNFPSTNKILESDEFLSKTSDYFGGQKINEVLQKAADTVVSGYQNLPFEVQARKTYSDSAGKAFTGQGTLTDGVAEWQSSLIEYAKQQGFEVKE